MEATAYRPGRGNPSSVTAQPMALVPPESGPLPLPTGAGVEQGTPGRVHVLSLRHVPGGPRCPHQANRATGTSSSRTNRVRGPATSTPGTSSLAPFLAYTVRHQPFPPRTPRDWWLPRAFIHELVWWVRALAWMPRPAEVCWAQLALDYEAFVGKTDHRLCGTHLPLVEQAPIPRKAVGLAELHLAAGTLLSGAHLRRCRLLLSAEGHVCLGLA